MANEMAFPKHVRISSRGFWHRGARSDFYTVRRAADGWKSDGRNDFPLAGAVPLREGADKVLLDLGIGPTTVGLEWGQNSLSFARMKQTNPIFGPIVTDIVAVAAALGIQPRDLAGGNLPVQVAAAGLPFLYVALNSRAGVDAAALDRAKLCALLGVLDLEELPVFVLSLQPADDGATVYSRLFAPIWGVPEDPATGSASGPLGAYLLKYNAVSAKTESRLVSLQGVRMGRPSRIHVALSSGAGVLEMSRSAARRWWSAGEISAHSRLVVFMPYR